MVILPQLKTLENGQMQKMRVHKKLLIKPKVLYHDFAVMMMGKGCSIQYLEHAVDNHALYAPQQLASAFSISI